MSDTRILIDRMATLRDAIDAGARPRNGGAERILLSVYNGGAMGTNGDAYFLGNPVQIDGNEQEGGAGTPNIDTTTTVPFVALRGAPAVGDLLNATLVGGRWVAEKTGNQKPKSGCRWLCGPYVQFDTPATGFGCTAALASVSVANDGTIAGATLINPGSCYQTPHPNAKILGGVGSGATLVATVGAVTSIAVTNGGSGYDPANPPTVTIAAPPPAGTKATATATVDPISGAVSSLNLTNGGAFYQVVNPTVTIAAPPGPGRQATATATAKPGVVTSLILTARGSGYVSNVAPAFLNLTVSCSAWTASFPLAFGGSTGGVAPPGSLPFCGFGGTTTKDLPGGPGCGTISGATLAGSVTWSSDLNNWVLAVDAYLNTPTKILGCGPYFAYGCLAKIGAGASDYETGGGPFGPQILTCPSRPFSWMSTAGSDMKREEPTSAVTWWEIGGGTCGGGTPTPMSFTFTLSEPPPS